MAQVCFPTSTSPCGPIPSDPGLVDLVLEIQEAKTGSLSGGLGYSDVQGIFGQVFF